MADPRKKYPLLFVVLISVGIAAPTWQERGYDTLRDAYTSIVIPEIETTSTHAEPWPAEDSPTTEVRLDAPGPLVAGSYTQLKLTITAGAGGIKTGGGIRVAFEHGADWGRLQVKRPRKENYATIHGPRGVLWRLNPNYQLGMCTAIDAVVEEGRVEEGDKFRLVLGDRAEGSPGFQLPTVSEVPGAGRIRVYEDRSGAGGFYKIPGVEELKILPGPPHHLRVIARSWSMVGEQVDATAYVADQYNNKISDYRGWFTTSNLDTGHRIGDLRILPEKNGVAVLEDVRCEEPGVFRVKVRAVAGGMEAYSNPIECLSKKEAPRTHFGSIHNHALFTDGLNTPEGATRYARDVSNLDFFALTEHAVWPDWPYDRVLLRHNLNEEQWNALRDLADRYNQPGFVTLFGLEWSTTRYGDKVVYFEEKAEFRKLPDDQENLYRSLQDERTSIVTHTMMGITGFRGPRWDLCDTDAERVMEIASYHGVREYAGNAYPICKSDRILPSFAVSGNLAAGVLERGLRLGFVAGSDDHSGKPGAGVKGILSCSIDGLTGIKAVELDREVIFEAFNQRRTYATTGARILLDFSVAGESMGSEMKIESGKERLLLIEAHGEKPIAEISVVKGDPTKPAKTWKFDPPKLDPGPLVWADGQDLEQSAWYYVRVIQEDYHMAWSSPVWVDVTPP